MVLDDQERDPNSRDQVACNRTMVARGATRRAMCGNCDKFHLFPLGEAFQGLTDITLLLQEDSDLEIPPFELELRSLEVLHGHALVPRGERTRELAIEVR